MKLLESSAVQRDPNWAIQFAFAVSDDSSRASNALQTLASPEFVQARRFLDAGNFEQARIRLDSVLSGAIPCALVLHLRAEVEIRAGAIESAIAFLNRAAELSPPNTAVLHSLAFCYYCQSRFASARNFADRMLAQDPLNLGARLLRAAIAAQSGDNELAALIYQGLVAEAPRHTPSILGLGHSLRVLGQAEGAVTAFREVLRQNPADAEAWACLAGLKTFQFSDDDLIAMLGVSRRPNLTKKEDVEISYALGRALFDRGRYDEAFAHYSRANAISRHMGPADPVQSAAEGRRWVEDTSAALSSAGAFEDPWVEGPTPIFIVGLPRSGTTLVEQILGSHPAIEATAELPYLAQIAERVMHQGADLRTIDRVALAREYLDLASVHRKTSRPYMLDKLPFNFRHIAFIRAILPQAKIVEVRRHPLASVVGMFRQNFLNLPEYSGSLGQLAETRRQYALTMDRFAQAFPGAVITVLYERLVEDTEAEIRRLLSDVALRFDEDCLRWYENRSPVRTPSSEQVRQPIFRQGLSEWKHFEPWLGEARLILADVT